MLCESVYKKQPCAAGLPASYPGILTCNRSGVSYVTPIVISINNRYADILFPANGSGSCLAIDLGLQKLGLNDGIWDRVFSALMM